jgi:hypothetical protein
MKDSYCEKKYDYPNMKYTWERNIACTKDVKDSRSFLTNDSLSNSRIRTFHIKNRTFNSTIKFLNRKTRRMKLNLKLNKLHKNSNSLKSLQDGILLPHCIYKDIHEIKTSQKVTENKVDFLISLFKKDDDKIDKNDNNDNNHNNIFRVCSNISLEFVHNMNCKLAADNGVLDYFSFKIKPDLSLCSINEIETMKPNSRDYKRNKCTSPDRLFTHKFFEDSDNFRNTNLMSVKTYTNNITGTNPFSLTGKSSDGISINNNAGNTEINYLHTNDIHSPINEEDNQSRDDLISMINYSEREGEGDTFKVKRKNTNLTSNHISEEESPHLVNIEKAFSDNTSNDFNTETKQIKQIKQTPSKNDDNININININSNNITGSNQANVTQSDNNDNSSLTSSKFNVDISNEKYKKVRGFNFKNNINTKKYTKPLLTSQSSGKENTSSVKENLLLNSSPNVDLVMKTEISLNKSEDKKIKKLNFSNISNNILSKKIIKTQLKMPNEKDVHYIVENEICENENKNKPITISDLTSHQ